MPPHAVIPLSTAVIPPRSPISRLATSISPSTVSSLVLCPSSFAQRPPPSFPLRFGFKETKPRRRREPRECSEELLSAPPHGEIIKIRPFRQDTKKNKDAPEKLIDNAVLNEEPELLTSGFSTIDTLEIGKRNWSKADVSRQVSRNRRRTRFWAKRMNWQGQGRPRPSCREP